MSKPFARKLIDRALDIAFRYVGRDVVSGCRIHSRDDASEIGSAYGGWVIPAGLFDAGTICYCVGCGEDISFDLGMIERFGCPVFGFDPTPRAIAYVATVAADIPQYKFFDFGLWDKEEALKFYTPQNPDHVSHSLVNLQGTDDYIIVNVRRLKDVMAELGHAAITLLKIDIEGAEYRVLESAVQDALDITVICVEYDEFQNPLDSGYKRRIRESMSGLMSAGYSLVSAQGSGNYTFVKEPCK